MIAAFIFFRIIKSCKSRTGAAEPGAGADFACTLPGLPVRAGIYCEAKIIQAAPTAKFIWRLWPCGLFSGEIGARTAYLRPVLSSSPAVLLRHALFPRHAESLPPPPCPFPSARRSSLAPSRPSDYLLPAPASFPAPAVPVVFSGGRRFWHENAKYFFIWEIIVNFLLLLAFNMK